MEKKNTLLRYAGIRDDGYRDYLEVVLLGNMTDALTERMRKAIAASGFDLDPMELHLPSWPDKPTVYEIVSFSATADSADGDISCEDFVSSFEKPCTSKEGEKSETAEDDEYIDSGTRVQAQAASHDAGSRNRRRGNALWGKTFPLAQRCQDHRHLCRCAAHTHRVLRVSAHD